MNAIQLYDYQIEHAEKALTGQVFNFSEVGTGKTFSGLEAFIKSNCNRLLIICLASKVSDFASDASKIGLGVTALDKGTKRNSELLEASEHVAISFESSWRLTELENWVDDKTFILIDESHKVKNRGSKVGYFVAELAKKASITYLMTATPITNGKYEEYFQQLVIAKIIPDDWKAFKSRYVVEELQSVKVGGKDRYFNQIVGYKNVAELESLVNEHAVRQERAIQEDMKPLFVQYTVKKPTMYGKIQKQRVVTLDSGEVKEYDSTSSVYHALRQLSSGVLNGIGKTIRKDKLSRLEDLLDTLDERVVIFYTYDCELQALKTLMKKLKRPFSEYNGNKHDKSNFTKYSNGIELVQYKAGSTGVNGFQIASVAVFFSQPSGSTEHIQAVGRINRIGQTKQPIVYELICENSVESKVADMIAQGIDITENMFEGMI